MELIAIFLSGLLGLFSNGGWVIEAIAKSQIATSTSGDRLISVEQQAIRIDNTPNYQIVQGKIDQVRIAGRGVTINSYLRIDTLELETDAIAIDPKNLNTKSLDHLRSSLLKPLQGVGKIILTEADLTEALESPEVTQQIQKILNNLVARKAGNTTIAYEVSNLQVELNPDNRIKIELEMGRLGITQKKTAKLAIALEFGIESLAGTKIQLVQPVGTVNGRPMSSRLLKGFAQGLSDRLDLTKMESQGIFARLLQLEITADQIELIAFARMETKSASISSTEILNISSSF